MSSPTIVTMSQCRDLDQQIFNIPGSDGKSYLVDLIRPHCECLSFKYNKTRICKHIEQAKEIGCTWHEMHGKPQEEKEICPECGGPTKYVKVGIECCPK